jgi:hypothetical protein
MNEWGGIGMAAMDYLGRVLGVAVAVTVAMVAFAVILGKSIKDLT